MVVREYWKGNQIWIIHQSKEKLIRNIIKGTKMNELVYQKVAEKLARDEMIFFFFLIRKDGVARIFVYI